MSLSTSFLAVSRDAVDDDGVDDDDDDDHDDDRDDGDNMTMLTMMRNNNSCSAVQLTNDAAKGCYA